MCRLFLFCLLFTLGFTCNNYCSGHGKCSTDDRCECFMGWGGADCSLRSCPYDDAFVDIPLGDINHNGAVKADDDAKDEWRPKGGIAEDLSNYVTATRAHRYAECSNAGICDRNSGECVCFDGYEGSACQRRSCPNVDGKVCSGHGKCLTSTAIISDNKGTYFGWESEKYMSCVCDSNWEGIDCSMRVCPKGFDPIVLSGVTFNYRITGGATNGGNELYYVATANDFYFQFTYGDMIYESSIISKIDTNSYPKCKANGGGVLDGNVDASTLSQITENIRRSIITNVPYLSQATVSFVCGKEGGASAVIDTNIAADLLISTTQGDVKLFGVTSNELEVLDKDGKASSVTAKGVIITSDSKKITYDSINDKIEVSGDTDDKAKAYTLCSRRGLCQSDTGECKCFNGFSGEACQTQRSILI